MSKHCSIRWYRGTHRQDKSKESQIIIKWDTRECSVSDKQQAYFESHFVLRKSDQSQSETGNKKEETGPKTVGLISGLLYPMSQYLFLLPIT